MIRYKKIQIDPNSRGGTAGKWFIRPVVEETMDLDAMAQHMSEHNTPFSPGTIRGVLIDFVKCTKEQMLNGKNVKVGDLAIFSVGIQCKGATSAENLTVADNVTSVKFRARATGGMTRNQLNIEAVLKEINEYSTTTNGEAAA